MAAVTTHSDFGAQENKTCHFQFSSSIRHEVVGPDAMNFPLLFVMKWWDQMP